MKMYLKFVMIFILVFLFMPNLVLASEIELLVDRLVEKGVLSSGEARQILVEAEHEARKKEIEKEEEKGVVPDWVYNMNWGGDFRLRYETSRVKTDSSKSSRNRSRFRFRYGFTTDVNEQMKVGFRMASGSADPTSANQTFDGAFSSKNLWIDRAYLQYAFLDKNLTFFGGKFPNPFDTVADLVWDGDINPEGGALKIKVPTETADYFINLAVMPLRELSGTSSPYILGGQLGLGLDILDKPFKTSVAYYSFEHFKGKSEDTITRGSYTPGTNTFSAGDNYAYDYKVLNFNAEYTPLTLDMPNQKAPLKIFGGYIYNTASGVSDDKGFLTGLSLGRARSPGEWSVGYTYYRIEKDAVPAIINGVDFNTNRRGHKVGVSYALLDNTTLSASYFNIENIKESKRDQHKLQVNLQVKF